MFTVSSFVREDSLLGMDGFVSRGANGLQNMSKEQGTTGRELDV